MILELTIRQAESEGYDLVIASLDDWWGGRDMAAMLPRLFFTHFKPWTYVAEIDGDSVGFLAAFQSQTNPQQVYCHFIGVGDALYMRLIADAARRDCREVLAVTSPTNRASVAFTRRLGFRILPGAAVAAGTPFTPDNDGPGEYRVRFYMPVGHFAPQTQQNGN